MHSKCKHRPARRAKSFSVNPCLQHTDGKAKLLHQTKARNHDRRVKEQASRATLWLDNFGHIEQARINAKAGLAGSRVIDSKAHVVSLLDKRDHSSA